jgi:hypothetical protein
MTRIPLALTTAWIAAAGVIDRVAVTVGNQVITQSEVVREARLTEMENAQPLDLGPAARRAAAERLVDQQLIRNEMEIGNYPKPSAAEGESMLQAWRKEHLPDPARYRAALDQYGVTEEELKQRLLWQLAAIRFTDQRFQAVSSTSETQSADRSSSDAETAVEQQMEAWLNQQRRSTRIQFKKEAFE